MRRTALIQAALAATALTFCAGMQLPAQQAHHLLALAGGLGKPQHLPPATANPPTPPKAELDATGLGSPVLLDKGWRVGVTANPSAADADYDDTNWAVHTVGDSLDGLDDLDHPSDGKAVNVQQWPPAGHERPYVWFRMHVKLAPHHGPLALLIELPVTPNSTMSINATGPGVDVFANGKQIQPEGPHGDAPGRYQEISRLYNLNLSPTDTDVVLVARTIYIPFGLSAYTSFFANGTLRMGSPPDLQRVLELWSVHSLFERLPRLVNAILFTVLSLFLLALYFTQKGHVEYLWLALHEFIQAPIGFIDLAGTFARLDQIWYAAAVVQLVMISAYLYFEFLIAFLALKKRWYIILLRFTAPILAGVGPALLLMGSHSVSALVTMGVVFLGTALWMTGWTLFTFITLIRATLRRNFEAGLLLIPLMLTIVGIVEPMLTGGMSDFSGHPYRSPLTIQAGMIPIHFASIADFAGLLAIVLIIFVRFLRIQRDQEHANSELAAARSVQELMIPQEKLETPGYEVDSVYTPANEVGGDFFHVQPSGDGGMLVVIGDVAGKGLQAAMTVSMLMGALRRISERSPGRILESLNRVLTGGEGLTTCQAIWFGANGELVVANAGHLPPYLNTQEIVLPGGLPLGAIPDVSYDEVSLYLHPGDRLLLLSDGVVEARRPTGELFGFERVHNLSNQTAFYIADAAKEFGQEDDITVLTVRRLAQAMAA